MVRRWFGRGMRPRMFKDQRPRSAYILGAVCPTRDTGAAIVLTHVSVAAMNLLLEDVAAQLPAGTHAAMLIDNDGWHIANDLRVPQNISLVHLPPPSPELNAMKRSGSTCGTATYRAGCSAARTPSSMPAARLGTSSLAKPAASRR